MEEIYRNNFGKPNEAVLSSDRIVRKGMTAVLFICFAFAKQINTTIMKVRGVLMANKENMTLRIDPALKKEATQLFKSLGLSLSAATEIFYRQALRKKGLPFAVVLEEPNEKTSKAIEDAKKKKDVLGPFDNSDDLMKALNAKD